MNCARYGTSSVICHSPFPLILRHLKMVFINFHCVIPRPYPLILQYLEHAGGRF